MFLKRYILLLLYVILVNEIVAQEISDGAINNRFRDDETYKLIFVTEFQGKRFAIGESEADKRRPSIVENFIAQLNDAGSRNYRMMLSSGYVAITHLDESKYEYDWFETISSVHFVKSGLSAKLNEIGQQGYRVVEHSPVGQSCEFLDSNDPAFGEKCVYKDLFLIEKEIGSKKEVEQIVSGSPPGWGGRPSEVIATDIDKKISEGFYPARAVSDFELLLERISTKEDVLEEKVDVKIVRSAWGTNNVRSKINAMAKQGYRLAIANNRIAVLYKNEETLAKPSVRYIWLQTDKKSFPKEVQKLQRKGVRFVTTHPNERGVRNTLIFEQPLSENQPQDKFKILSFAFDVREDQVKGIVYRKLTQASQENVKTMNELAIQGFVPRGLFTVNGTINVILELKS